MILFLLDIAGAVALLLWAVRLIRRAVERAFMAELRGLVRRAGAAGPRAAAAGFAAALMLQSSTAVALIAAGFAGSGALAPAPAVALILGADLGSALVALLLLAPVGALAPALLVAGVAAERRARRPGWRQGGRILIGLALVFVALGLLRAATAPLAESPVVALVLGYLDRDPWGAFALGAVFALALQSSVAAVLTVVTLAGAGLLPAMPAAALVLGANLGGAAVAVLLTLGDKAPARRIVTANLALRGGGALAALGLVLLLPPGPLAALPGGAAAQALGLHIGFNLALVALCLPLRSAALRLAARLLPDPPAPAAPPTALDPALLGQTDRALACATRELLRMAERLHGMLLPVLDLCRDWSPDTAAAIAAGERDVDRMHFEIKLYVSRVQEAAITARQSRRAMDIAAVAAALEDAGDQIATHLVAVARRMQEGGLAFSGEGWRDLAGFHDRVAANARLALDVLLAGDPGTARQLIAGKDRVRRIEQDLQARHLARLRRGSPETLETSNLHQEVLRALKQVNSGFTRVAYPIAEQTGELRDSRLADAS